VVGQASRLSIWDDRQSRVPRETVSAISSATKARLLPSARNDNVRAVIERNEMVKQSPKFVLRN